MCFTSVCSLNRLYLFFLAWCFSGRKDFVREETSEKENFLDATQLD